MSSITFETSPTSSSESTSITDCPLFALASSLASTEVASIPKNKSQIKSNLLNLKSLINIVTGIPPLTKTHIARTIFNSHGFSQLQDRVLLRTKRKFMKTQKRINSKFVLSQSHYNKTIIKTSICHCIEKIIYFHILFWFATS